MLLSRTARRIALPIPVSLTPFEQVWLTLCPSSEAPVEHTVHFGGLAHPTAELSTVVIVDYIGIVACGHPQSTTIGKK